MGPGLRRLYRRRHRLTHAREYAAVRADGIRKARGALLITLLPTDRPEHRLGLQVGKRIGKATVRVRAKRLIREAFRLTQRDLPRPEHGSYDIVVSARAVSAGLESCIADLTGAVHAAHKHWQKADAKRARPDASP